MQIDFDSCVHIAVDFVRFFFLFATVVVVVVVDTAALTLANLYDMWLAL